MGWSLKGLPMAVAATILGWLAADPGSVGDAAVSLRDVTRKDFPISRKGY
jgi:hypothetical protein